MPLLVAPFFRASCAVGPRSRRLFVRALLAPDFEAMVRDSEAIFRQNLRRLFAAARLAEAAGARLAFVEGFRSNRVVSPAGRARFVTGSWMFALMLRLLQRRGLVAPGLRPLRRDVSRCTSEEAAVLVELAAAVPVIGVTDTPCPSARRARRYLRRVGSSASAEVVSPEDALARAGDLSAGQAAFWRAIAPRRAERWLAPFVEAPNWGVHWLSEAARRAGVTPPLERRLAHRLRPDRRE